MVFYEVITIALVISAVKQRDAFEIQISSVRFILSDSVRMAPSSISNLRKGKFITQYHVINTSLGGAEVGAICAMTMVDVILRILMNWDKMPTQRVMPRKREYKEVTTLGQSLRHRISYKSLQWKKDNPKVV
jgi:hypothetical protein